MSNRGAWIAFLLVCFALTGLVGLFASYAAAIPLERTLHRAALLDQAEAAGPDAAAVARGTLGPAIADLLAGDGDLPSRSARARATIFDEGRAEAGAVAARTRMLIAVVTLLSAAVGTGIVLLAGKPRPR